MLNNLVALKMRMAKDLEMSKNPLRTLVITHKSLNDKSDTFEVLIAPSIVNSDFRICNRRPPCFLSYRCQVAINSTTVPTHGADLVDIALDDLIDLVMI